VESWDPCAEWEGIPLSEPLKTPQRQQRFKVAMALLRHRVVTSGDELFEVYLIPPRSSRLKLGEMSLRH
jgi:hypothetical protein